MDYYNTNGNFIEKVLYLVLKIQKSKCKMQNYKSKFKIENRILDTDKNKNPQLKLSDFTKNQAECLVPTLRRGGDECLLFFAFHSSSFNASPFRAG